MDTQRTWLGLLIGALALATGLGLLISSDRSPGEPSVALKATPMPAAPAVRDEAGAAPETKALGSAHVRMLQPNGVDEGFDGQGSN